MAHTAPAQVGHVYESVHTAQVDEYTIGSDVLDHALEYLTFLELGDDLLLLLFQIRFDQRLVRYDHVLELVVDLHDAELHGLVHIGVVIADGLDIDL